MKIAGLQGTTLIDFPGRIATIVFLAGCDLRCPFCQNPDLVLRPGEMSLLPLEDLLADLERRRRLVDGLVISGGEPLLQDLAPLLGVARDLGYGLKVDTNGTSPERLAALIAEGLVDMVGMDAKTDEARYARLGGTAGADTWSRVLRTASLALEAGLELEVRTTVAPGWIDEPAMEQIAPALARIGVRRYVLQQFEPDHCLDPAMREIEPLPGSALRALADIAAQHLPEVDLRGLLSLEQGR